ncbi:HbrB-like-domain-containing protein [Mycena floridula]|nr:HbrB-like-domain-containing protein [Mycena floridula]
MKPVGWGRSNEHGTALTERRQRSSSDVAMSLLRPVHSGQKSPTTPTIRFPGNSNQELPQKHLLSSSSTSDLTAGTSRSLRPGLGALLAEKITSSLSGTGNQKSSQQLLHPHSNSLRTATDSPVPPPTPPRALAPIIIATANMAGIAKAHTSPSKASYGRTYDGKLVSREMHRLGNILPGTGLVNSISQAPTAAAGIPAPGAMHVHAAMSQANVAAASGSDPWGALHVHVLPLFNGEPLRIAIEDLNILVKRHISSTISSSPGKAVQNLENDAAELIASGMVTLNAKLSNLEDDKLVGRVVEIWGFFWDQVLTYIEGVLLPLQTDPLLLSLHRTPKRPSSPSRSAQKSSAANAATSNQIDVRTVALRSFRDKVILPLASRLYTRLASFSKQETFQDSSYQQPRLQQMLLVLTAQGRQQRPKASLTVPPPPPTTGETVVADLLRIIRVPNGLEGRLPVIPGRRTSRAPSFLSGAIPRDRRGRIAQKQQGKGAPTRLDLTLPEEEDGMSGDETPRVGVLDRERERERVMLESLRSPGLETPARVSTGGWGLGITHQDGVKPAEEEDEPELNWDQAQELVERMVGMDSEVAGPRRRLT